MQVFLSIPCHQLIAVASSEQRTRVFNKMQSERTWKSLATKTQQNKIQQKTSVLQLLTRWTINTQHWVIYLSSSLLIHHGQFSTEYLQVWSEARSVIIWRDWKPSEPLRHRLWNSQTCDLTSTYVLNALCRKHAWTNAVSGMETLRLKNYI